MVRNRYGSNIKIVMFALLILLNHLTGNLCAEEISDSPVTQFTETVRKPIILKLMVVNPSAKFDQTFPIKAYLPKEVKPEYIIDSQDLQVDYDSEKDAYFLAQDLVLKPGESVVKAVKLKDVWFIPDERLTEVTTEAHELMTKLKGTEFEDRARLLIVNIETLLLQIYESQSEVAGSPDDHISAFRNNKKKLDDIEMDLMILRRFLASVGADAATLPSFVKAQKEMGTSMPAFLTDAADGIEGGGGKQISPMALWRIVFIVLAFIGIVSLLFFGIWQHQLRITSKRKKSMNLPRKKKTIADAPDGVKISDLMKPRFDAHESRKKGAA